MAILIRENVSRCFVRQSDDMVGYVGPLRTMKYAQRLIDKWHNKTFDGQQLRCQIELNIRSTTNGMSSRTGPRVNLATKEDDNRGFAGHRRRSSTNRSGNNSRDSSISRSDSDTGIRVVDEPEFNYEVKRYDRSIQEVVKQKGDEIKNKSKSTESFPSSERKSKNSLSSFSCLYVSS